MGIEDLAKQAGDFAKDNADKIQEALKSEQAEGISDKILDGVSGFAKKVAPGAADKIDEVRDNVDKSIGNE